MFSEKDDSPQKAGSLAAPSPAVSQGECPVLRCYAEGLRKFLPPYLLRELSKREATIARSRSTPEMQTARAMRLAHYAVTVCLPEGLAMFNFARQGDTLRALPVLSEPEALPKYLAALQDVRATPWNPRDHGANMFRAALLRPLEGAEQALTLLREGEPVQACTLLMPALERLGKLGGLLPLLDNLLTIRPDKAKPGLR